MNSDPSPPLDFIVIGAQKAASTWLTHVLDAHPQLYIPRDEIPCFEADFPESPSFAVPPKTPGNILRVGVKNNNLLFSPDAPVLIRQSFPAIKLVATLRNPVERAISAYYWYMRVGVIPVAPPERGIADILSTNPGLILEPGFYGRQLSHFLCHFDRAQIHVAIFDDIRESPIAVTRRLYEFLGVSTDHIPGDATASKPKETIYSLPRLRWNNLRNPLILYSAPRSPHRVLWKQELGIITRMANAAVVGLDRLFLRPLLGNPKYHVPTELRAQLYEVYREDIGKTEQLLDRDLPGWHPKSMGP